MTVRTTVIDPEGFTHRLHGTSDKTECGLEVTLPDWRFEGVIELWCERCYPGQPQPSPAVDVRYGLRP